MGYPWEIEIEGNAQRDEQRRTGHKEIKLGLLRKMQLAHGTKLIRQIVLAAHQSLVNSVSGQAKPRKAFCRRQPGNDVVVGWFDCRRREGRFCSCMGLHLWPNSSRFSRRVVQGRGGVKPLWLPIISHAPDGGREYERSQQGR